MLNSTSQISFVAVRWPSSDLESTYLNFWEIRESKLARERKKKIRRDREGGKD